ALRWINIDEMPENEDKEILFKIRLETGGYYYCTANSTFFEYCKNKKDRKFEIKFWRPIEFE
ncbi:MAG: hypothetical protein FWF72_01080, partial [Paludibacter sp.]|nr:hypothetical protein [Paludibacter sp.]